jgi:uncharacterized protein
MQAFVEYVVKGLVRHPEAVSVTPVHKGPETVCEIRLDPSDMGRIIGKDGAMINALRSLLLAGSAKKGIRCSLDVVEERPEQSEPKP